MGASTVMFVQVRPSRGKYVYKCSGTQEHSDTHSFVQSLNYGDGEAYRNKGRLLELSQCALQLDINMFLDHWHRLIISRQNQDFRNKFWLANYAAELDMRLFIVDQKQREQPPDLAIPLRVTLLIDCLWDELKRRYAVEHEICSIKVFEELVVEDTLVTAAFTYFAQRGSFDDLAVKEFIQLGFITDEIKPTVMNAKARDIREALKHVTQAAKMLKKHSSPRDNLVALN